MIHNGRDRDSLLMPMDDRTADLMLQFSVQLVRCEPTTRITEFRTWGTHASGDGILHDGRERFNLEAWTEAEWVAFRDNFVRVLMRYWDDKFELTPNRAWYQARHAIGAPSASTITCSMSIGPALLHRQAAGGELPLLRPGRAATWLLHPPRPLP